MDASRLRERGKEKTTGARRSVDRGVGVVRRRGESSGARRDGKRCQQRSQRAGKIAKAAHTKQDGWYKYNGTSCEREGQTHSPSSNPSTNPNQELTSIGQSPNER
jgi:hypothetical protein